MISDPIVVDFGTFEIKADFAGEEIPKIVERTVFHESIEKDITFLCAMKANKLPKDLSNKIALEYRNITKKANGTFQGKTFGARENYALYSAPSEAFVERGIPNFDCYEHIMMKLLNEYLKCDCDDLKLLTTLPPLALKSFIEKQCMIA